MAAPHNSDSVDVEMEYGFIDPGPAQCPPNLANMPGEIFSKICSSLDPIWLWNLSHAYGFAFRALSHEGGGNRLWYNVVPSFILQEGPMYQDMYELTTYVYLRSEGVCRMQNPLSAPYSSEVAASCFNGVPRIEIIGGLYQDVFNYKREIVGRFQEVRCHICLTPPSEPFEVAIIQQWGVKWCLPCFADYARDANEAVALLGPTAEYVEWAKLLRTTVKDLNWFYVPKINEELRIRGLPAIEMLELHQKKGVHAHQMQVLENDQTEVIRRQMRRAIVQIALAIWEGTSVAQALRSTGRKASSKGLKMYSVSPAQYRYWRESWLPSSKLAGFLYPKWRLDDHPTSCPYEAGPWLNDVTFDWIQNYRADLNSIKNFTLVNIAKNLIGRLTAFTDDGLSPSGNGWKLPAFREAARAYHEARILKHLDEWRVLHMEYVKPAERNSPKYRFIRCLRQRFDLVSVHGDQEVVRPFPERRETSANDGVSAHEFRTLDQRIVEEQNSYRERMKHFNKIMRRSCTMCPETHDCFYPCGLDGLLTHMESNHKPTFYRNDKWSMIC